MSRSYKKPYLAAVCYFSNKKDKKIAHKTFRSKEKEGMMDLLSETECLPYKMREVSDTYNFASDGLSWYRGDEVSKCIDRFGWAKWFKK